MQDYSFYSAILGLSSRWRISNVTVDKPSGTIELHIHSTSGSRFFCPACGKGMRPNGTRKARWSCNNETNLRFNISAVIPLLTCERCGTTEVPLPWEQTGFRCEEQAEETRQVDNVFEYA